MNATKNHLSEVVQVKKLNTSAHTGTNESLRSVFVFGQINSLTAMVGKISHISSAQTVDQTLHEYSEKLRTECLECIGLHKNKRKRQAYKTQYEMLNEAAERNYLRRTKKMKRKKSWKRNWLN